MNDYKERTDGAAYRLCSVRLDTTLYTYIIISILSMRDAAGEDGSDRFYYRGGGIISWGR